MVCYYLDLLQTTKRFQQRKRNKQKIWFIGSDSHAGHIRFMLVLSVSLQKTCLRCLEKHCGPDIRHHVKKPQLSFQSSNPSQSNYHYQNCLLRTATLQYKQICATQVAVMSDKCKSRDWPLLDLFLFQFFFFSRGSRKLRRQFTKTR